MKYETYKFKQGDVTLEFSFACDAKLEENKKIFVELMEEAKVELQKT